MKTSSHPTVSTRDRMIGATITLMRRSGFSGAGINEVIRESGAPKGSLYHYFPGGKEQLATEALLDYSRGVLAFMDAAMANETAAAAKVKALFGALARRLETGEFQSSCAAGTVTLDLEPETEPLRRVIAGLFSDWVDLIARHFAIADRRRAKSFAGLVLTAIEGAYVRGRAERSSKPFREAGAWLSLLAVQQLSHRQSARGAAQAAEAAFPVARARVQARRRLVRAKAVRSTGA
jgi:TetR/AcrR family transcriptional regulator, lmrAB and yxaGH operons repressor